jgi:hypothetical protein
MHVQGENEMTGNQALKKALACIVHPVSIGAILLLLLNDHFFRHWWPSWLTGKLGDFAWLFFFPFILAVALAGLLPRRLLRRDQWVGGLSLGLTGLVFSLVKTLPVFRVGFLHLLESILRFPVHVTGDATDLVALLSLVGGAWLWLKIDCFPAKKTHSSLAWLAAGMLLTIANMPQPDPGIFCLDRLENEIIACASYSCYGSTDGGLSWLELEEQPIACPDVTSVEKAISEKTAVPAETGVTYFFTPGENIQRSTGSDSAAVVEYEIQPVSQAQKAYYFKTHTGNPILVNSPQDGIFDPASENVIFSMGHEGVLVRQAQGNYQLVEVGRYGKVKTTQLQVLMITLIGEIALAACFGGLVVVALGLHEERSKLKKLVSIFAIIIWLFPVFFVPPALSAGSYAAALSSIATVVVGMLILPLVLDGFFLVGILAPDSLLKLGILALEGMLIFLVPFIMWGVNLLPDYRIATFLAIVIGGGFIIFQYRALMVGTSMVKPEVSAQIEPQWVLKSGWYLLAGAALAVGGIALTLFGLYFGIAGVIIGLGLMLSGVWLRRKVWMSAKKDVVEPEGHDRQNEEPGNF